MKKYRMWGFHIDIDQFDLVIWTKIKLSFCLVTGSKKIVHTSLSFPLWNSGQWWRVSLNDTNKNDEKICSKFYPLFYSSKLIKGIFIVWSNKFYRNDYHISYFHPLLNLFLTRKKFKIDHCVIWRKCPKANVCSIHSYNAY